MFATTDTTGANTTADGLPTFTTTPVRVPMLGAGCRDIELRINTITSVAGFVAVELRTADGRALPGYGLASSNQIKGNFIGTEPQSSCRSVPTPMVGLTAPLWGAGRAASWGDPAGKTFKRSLRTFAGQALTMRVVLPAAELYSLTFQCIA